MGDGFDSRTLLNPEFYDHPVTAVELIETHISWIFLAGEFAYKVKKPVNLGFLDFSTLQKRQYFCNEELRLNRRIAPQFYLAVVTIGGDRDSPELNGVPVFEYAVKMKRFPQEHQLDRMLAAGGLTVAHLDKFAAYIAAIHQRIAAAAADTPYGTPQAVMAPVIQNFRQIKSLASDKEMLSQLDRLESWSFSAYEQLKDVLRQRKAAGFIRECHGDIHLGNMAWYNEEPLLFDCIEFSDNLHWIDTVNDIAFLLMDLEDRGEEVLAGYFLNAYLRASGDYAATALLRFYKVYRALVRAKVIALRLSQSGLPPAERAADHKLLLSYLDLASSYVAKPRPVLMITHGLSGSGKSFFAGRLAPLCAAVTLHSDVERKRLFNVPLYAGSQSSVAGGIYSAEAGAKTYDRLCELAAIQLAAGISVIIDATFTGRDKRYQARALAEKYQVPFFMLDFPLGEEELKRRLVARSKPGESVSEATTEVLDYQRAHEDPLSQDETLNVLRVFPETQPMAIAARIFHRFDSSI